MLIKNWSCRALRISIQGTRKEQAISRRDFSTLRKCQASLSWALSFFLLLLLSLSDSSVSQTVSTRELGIQKLFMHLQHSITILPSHLNKYLREANTLCVLSIPLSLLTTKETQRGAQIPKYISYCHFRQRRPWTVNASSLLALPRGLAMMLITEGARSDLHSPSLAPSSSCLKRRGIFHEFHHVIQDHEARPKMENRH